MMADDGLMYGTANVLMMGDGSSYMPQTSAEL